MQETGYLSSQDNFTEETSEPAVGTEKPVQEDVGPGEPGDKLKEEEVTGKHDTQEMVSGDFHHMVQPAQVTENPKVIGQDNAEQGTEGAAEKPVQESEAGAKPGEKPAQESEDVGKKPRPEAICVEESDLQLKEGPTTLDRVQETENPTVGSVEKSERENKSVEESGKEGRMSQPVQEAKNPNVSSMEKSKPETDIVEESNQQGNLADSKMPEPVQETVNPALGNAEKGELENKSAEESGMQGRGGESDSQGNVAGPMPSNFEMAEPIQASENSAEFNETEHETTHEQGGHQVDDDRQNGDSSRDFPGQDFTSEDYSIFGIPLD